MTRDAAEVFLLIEPLEQLKARRVWPFSPLIIEGELFSSWLWRAAVGFRVPPDKFLALIPSGGGWGDIDLEFPADALEDLARMARRPMRALGQAMLRPPAGYPIESDEANLHAALARSRKLLLETPSPARRPVLQYCPVCLADAGQPWFRRSWRFAHVVVCECHDCRLWDRCWDCDAPVRLLADAAVASMPACHVCRARLSAADVDVLPRRLVRQQAAISTVLSFLVNRGAPEAEIAHALDRISTLPRSIVGAEADRRPLRHLGARERTQLFARIGAKAILDRMIAPEKRRPQDDWARRIFFEAHKGKSASRK